MANENFWTNAPAQDPKRGFRFKVSIPGLTDGASDPIWWAKKAEKPSVSFTEASHNYLNHTYYWPARAEWNEVSVTMVDPVDPDAASGLVLLVQAAGYDIPAGIANTEDFASMSKAGAIDALGTVLVEQINELGDVLESWTLNNAWIKEVTFGELDYGSDDLTELTIKFRYDWATFGAPGTDPVFTGPGSSA